jgi:hypothetical protein
VSLPSSAGVGHVWLTDYDLFTDAPSLWCQRGNQEMRGAEVSFQDVTVKSCMLLKPHHRELSTVIHLDFEPGGTERRLTRFWGVCSSDPIKG